MRLAYVLRLGNQAAGALATLEKIGPPGTPAIDPDWWVEVGEEMLVLDDAQKAAARLAPVVPELANHAPVRVVLGAAQLASGQADSAVKTLDEG